jgi:hypothetical protein
MMEAKGRQGCMLLVFVFELALERERATAMLGMPMDGDEMGRRAAPPTMLGPPVSYVLHMTCLALPASAFFLFPLARTCCVRPLGESASWITDRSSSFLPFFDDVHG